jgi:hypothetical protein
MPTQTDANNNTAPEIPRVAITPAEFGARFGKSQTWAYRRIYAGKVKVIPGCRPQLIPITEVGRFLATAARKME